MLAFIRHISHRALLPFVLAVGCFPSGLWAEAGDSLCVQLLGDAYIELRGSYTLSGKMPITFCDMGQGTSFRMTVGGTDYERRVGRLSIEEHGRPSVAGIRFGAVMRNALLPGYGSCYSGRCEAGWIDGLSLATSLYLLYEEDRQFRDLEDRYDDLTQRLAETDLIETQRLLSLQAHETALEAQTQNDHRRRLALFSAVLYGLQVLDPLLLSAPPRSSIGSGANTIRIEVPRSSTAKAFFYSLIHPGRGQFYQGKKSRGLFFSAATVASALAALEMHNRYDQEVLRYEILVERYEAVPTIDEKERLLLDAAEQWDEVCTAKNARNAAYIVTAGLWGWNLLDTLWQGNRQSKAARYSFEWSPLEGAVVITF